MTQRCSTSPPPPSLSSTWKKRQSNLYEDLNDDQSTIPDDYNACWDDSSKFDSELLSWPSRNPTGKWPSKDLITSTLGMRVSATQCTSTLVPPPNPEHREVCLVSEEEYERQPAPLAAKKILHYVFKLWNSPANEDIYYSMDSNEAGKQLIAWKAENLGQYEPQGDDVTNFIVGAEYDAQTTLLGVLSMVMAHVTPIGINYVWFVNPFAINAVKTTLIHSWWYEDIARFNPSQRKSDVPYANISEVNQSSQRVFSSLTLCIKLSQ